MVFSAGRFMPCVEHNNSRMERNGKVRWNSREESTFRNIPEDPTPRLWRHRLSVQPSCSAIAFSALIYY
eukprot:scaffold95617_cov16-Prasinocladus_malaysianus.AAC.1